MSRANLDTLGIFTLLVAAADTDELRELRGLVFWRERELRAEQVGRYAPGDFVEYLLADGRSHRKGRVVHLNRFSLSISVGGARQVAIPIERIIQRLEPNE